MLVGHRRNINYLLRVLLNGMAAHTYLFHGPESVGKKAVAFELARSLLCERGHADFGGCGECWSCRAVAALTHPDFIFLSPENLLVDGEGQRAIGIKNIRELRRMTAERPWSGEHRVVIIDDAENLSRDAQSALLKTLEEPGEGTVFMLITSSPAALLSTVSSRSVSLGFSFVDDGDMEPLLGGVLGERKRKLLEIAEGRPGILVRLVSDENFERAVSAKEAGLWKIAGADLWDMLAFSGKTGREPGELETLILFLVRERRKTLGKRLTAGGRGSEILSAARFLESLLWKLAVIRSTAANRRLVADSIFFDLHSLAPRGLV